MIFYIIKILIIFISLSTFTISSSKKIKKIGASLNKNMDGSEFPILIGEVKNYPYLLNQQYVYQLLNQQYYNLMRVAVIHHHIFF
jgi:hypothetical protein